MCKLLIVPGINEKNYKAVQDFAFEMSVHMSVVDDDGLGYALLRKDGTLSGERWFDNKQAFRDRTDVTAASIELAKDYEGVLDPQYSTKKYGAFGKGGDWKDGVALTLHTRMATCEKTFDNVHPFVSPDGNTSLIHNGIIRNHEKLTKVTSTNDSEVILHEYLKHGVNNNIDAIQTVADSLVGYYACALFSKKEDGTHILDIFKETQANLCAVLIKEFGGLVYATSFDHVEKSCKTLGLTINQYYKFKDNHILRLDPFTGKKLDARRFTSGSKFEYSGSSYGQGWDSWRNAAPKEEKVEAGKEGAKEAREIKEVKPEISGLVVIQGMTDKQLTSATADYSLKRMKDEKKSVIMISEIKDRLAKFQRDNKIDKIVDGLEKDYHFEQYFDSDLNQPCIRRKIT